MHNKRFNGDDYISGICSLFKDIITVKIISNIIIWKERPLDMYINVSLDKCLSLT